MGQDADALVRRRALRERGLTAISSHTFLWPTESVLVQPNPFGYGLSSLEAFFDEYDVEEMLIAETEAEATAHGWAPPPDDLPGTWRKNPEGEQTRPYARVCLNGRFNEHAAGFETVLEDGDRVALIYPFMFCC